MRAGIAGPMPGQSVSRQPTVVTALAPKRRAMNARDPVSRIGTRGRPGSACGRRQRTSGPWIRASLQHPGYNAVASLGLTIGYGDLAPRFLLTRALEIAIGMCGVLFTARVVAIAARALTG